MWSKLDSEHEQNLMKRAHLSRNHQHLGVMMSAIAVLAQGALVKVGSRFQLLCKLCHALCYACKKCGFVGRSQQKSPFGSSGNTGAKRNANPFGPEKGTRTFNEPADLSPTMKPIPIDDTPWYKKITLSQVVSNHSPSLNAIHAFLVPSRIRFVMF